MKDREKLREHITDILWEYHIFEAIEEIAERILQEIEKEKE